MSAQVTPVTLDAADFAADDWIIVRPALIKKLNGFSDGVIVLSRINYRAVAQRPDDDGHQWWRCSVQELADEIGFSWDQMQRIMKKLVNMGLVLTKVNNVNSYDRTKSYRANVADPAATKPVTRQYAKSRNGTGQNRVMEDAKSRNPPLSKTLKKERLLSQDVEQAAGSVPVEAEKVNPVRETSTPPKIKGLSAAVSGILARAGITEAEAPAVAAEVVKLNNVGGDGWWIKARDNGTLDDRIHEAVRALERVRESTLAREAAAVLGGMRAPQQAAPVAAPPYAKGWRQHKGCEWGYVGHKRCPSCVAETQTMAAAS